MALSAYGFKCVWRMYGFQSVFVSEGGEVAADSGGRGLGRVALLLTVAEDAGQALEVALQPLGDRGLRRRGSA